MNAGWGYRLGVGLLMGLYAFDGPLSVPGFLGDYSDFARRLSRLGHSYCIVLGLLSIYVTRQADAGRPPLSTRRVGIPLLVAGTLLTIGVQCLVAASWLSVVALAAGPALVALALVLCLDLSAVAPSMKSTASHGPGSLKIGQLPEWDVRRAKVLVFSGCESHPATWSFWPVAVQAARKEESRSLE